MVEQVVHCPHVKVSLGKTLNLKHTGTNSYFCVLQKIRQLSGSTREADEAIREVEEEAAEALEEGAEEELAEEEVPRQPLAVARKASRKASRKARRQKQVGDVR